MMAGIRLIARLDVKGQNLIKGVNLEGLRVIGDPRQYALKYYEQGADEFIYMDCVASLYGRNNLAEIVRHTSEDAFIPMTVGGGVRSVSDVEMLLRVGADKVAVNTAVVGRPQLITEIATRFGSQCMVLSIEAKNQGPGKWEAYVDNGREKTGLDVVEWAMRGEALGAGEILLTSIDREGTRKGFEVDLLAAVSAVVSIPIIASGGMGSVQDLVDVVKLGRADAVAMADILHYNRMTLQEIRQEARINGIEVSVR
jgi:imidazole glycerol-phosphate synthase subunit HisF